MWGKRRDGYDTVAIIHGQNITLRHLHEEDIPQLLKWNEDRELARLLEGDYPNTSEAYEHWLRDLRSARHRQAYAIELTDGRLIGDIELDHIAWRSGDAELRVRIGEDDARGRGYGTEAVRLMLAHAFGALNLRRVYLRVFQFNRRAIASYRKVGFKMEGAITRRTAQGAQARIILMRIFDHEFLSRMGASGQGIVVDM